MVADLGPIQKIGIAYTCGDALRFAVAATAVVRGRAGLRIVLTFVSHTAALMVVREWLWSKDPPADAAAMRAGEATA